MWTALTNKPRVCRHEQSDGKNMNIVFQEEGMTLLSLIYRKCTVPPVVSNGNYGSKSTGNSIQLPKPNLLFNLGQTLLRSKGTKKSAVSIC